MNKNYFLGLFSCFLGVMGFTANKGNAQNPIIHNQFTADPTARLFGDSIYLYPSHDIIPEAGKGKAGWFNMEDYHVFASADLVHWRDAGMVVSQYDVPWVDDESYSMWAPDCIEKNGMFYFYFPSQKLSPEGHPSFAIGVATSKSPTGPFIPEATPIEGVNGIDPNIFIDDDGQPYLYWAQGNIMGAKLKDNMMELASDVHILKDLPVKGLKEGPFVFKRAGKYYLTYPHVADRTERLEYAVSESPLGPFIQTGVIMEASAHCWTNHQSIIQIKGQWYLFYHSNDYSPNFDKARSARVDSLFFNADGTIQKVIPTFRGVGITSAEDTVQIDRYSALSKSGASISFLDTTDRFKGWALNLSEPVAWVRYNRVDFNQGSFKKMKLRVKADDDGKLILKQASDNNKILCRIPVKKCKDFVILEFNLLHSVKGVQDLIVSEEGAVPAKLTIDWLLFE